LQRGLTAAKPWCESWNININERKTRAISFPGDVLQLNGKNILFVKNVKYLGVIFDTRMTWRPYIERTAAKALVTYIKTYSLFRIERLSINIKVIRYKALFRSIIVYAYPTWEYAAGAHLLKLQPLENRVLRAIGNRGRRMLVRDVHVAFKSPYVYAYITKLCRTQAEVILVDRRNPNVRVIGQGEAMHRKHKKIKLGGGQAYDRSAD
jgi:hypothetical protein